MDLTNEFFLKILSCFLNEKELEIPLDEIDWNKIYMLSEIHCVQGMVWTVLKDNADSLPQEIRNKFEQAFVSSVNISIRQDVAMEGIKSALNIGKIEHVMMKGSVIKDYYPIKELRTMGDIDCLIHEQDREKCHNVMSKQGYKLVVKGVNVWEYQNQLAHVEVHSKIIYQKLFLGVDYSEYFSDVFENLVQVKGYTYEMIPEYHFVYLVVHLSKHLYRVGCGVRMVMDIPVFVKHFNDTLDWSLLEKKFREIKMWDFVKNLMYLCVKFFDCRLPDKVYNPNDEIADKLMDYILAAGIFGGYNRDEYAVKFGANNANKKGMEKFIGKMSGLRDLLCPSYDTMCGMYVWFNGIPKWMLPFGWCKRGYLQIKYSSKQIKGKLAGVLLDNQESQEHQKIMQMIGLIK
jgi:hypothetical protein